MNNSSAFGESAPQIQKGEYSVVAATALVQQVIVDRSVPLKDYKRIFEEVVPYVDSITSGDNKTPDKYRKYTNIYKRGTTIDSSDDKACLEYLNETVSQLKTELERVPQQLLARNIWDTPKAEFEMFPAIEFEWGASYNSVFCHYGIEISVEDWVKNTIKNNELSIEILNSRLDRTANDLQQEYSYNPSDYKTVSLEFEEYKDKTFAEAAKQVAFFVSTEPREIRAYIDIVCAVYYGISQGIPEDRWHDVFKHVVND